jgi:hypothetical protein
MVNAIAHIPTKIQEDAGVRAASLNTRLNFNALALHCNRTHPLLLDTIDAQKEGCRAILMAEFPTAQWLLATVNRE